MNKFLFKSTDADFKKMFSIIDNKLDLLQKNVLYSTHQLDFIRQQIIQLVTDKGLQKQVDEYFDETSHQTDSEEHFRSKPGDIRID